MNSTEFKLTISSLASASYRMEHYKWQCDVLSKHEKELRENIITLEEQLERERFARLNMGIGDSLRSLRRALKNRVCKK